MSTSLAAHRINRKRKLAQKKPAFVDNLIWPVAIAGPAFTIPQILLIWQTHDASGVSSLAWAGYTALSLIWILYASLHKEKVILLSSTLNFAVNILVLAGALLYS